MGKNAQVLVAILIMSILHFDEATLGSALAQLPACRVSAFAAACAGRLMHDVEQLQAGSQSHHLLAEAHDSVWRAIESGLPTDTSSLEEQLLEAMPDEDENGSFESAVVEDACAAMIYAMHSLYADAAQNAAWSARRVYETADRYASSFLNEPEYSDVAEDRILKHPTVQLELQRQMRDLDTLKEANLTDAAVLIEVKTLVSNERVLERVDG